MVLYKKPRLRIFAYLQDLLLVRRDRRASQQQSRQTDLDHDSFSNIYRRDLTIKRCFHRQELFDEMVKSFFAEADESIAKMREALRHGDLPELGRIGHRMKATVAYLGAEEVRNAGLAVEYFERHSGAPSDAEQAVNLFAEKCEKLKIALQNDELCRSRTFLGGDHDGQPVNPRHP